MKGFFDKGEFSGTAGGKNSRPAPTKKPAVPKPLTCKECGRLEKCQNRISTIYGKGKRKIFIVPEYPTAEENRTGIPGKGRPLEILREQLDRAGIDLQEDCWVLPALQCRPSYFGSVTDRQVLACSRFIRQAIEDKGPEKILILGSLGFKALIAPKLMGRATAPFETFVGELIPEPGFQATVGLTYGVEYVLSKVEKDSTWKKEWNRHIQAFAKAGARYNPDYQKDCHVTLDKDVALSWVKRARQEAEVIAFDYEATGIKPQAEGHEIVAVSFSDGFQSYGFPFFPDKDFRREWERLLRNPGIGKIAHNLKYEYQWTERLLGYRPRGWEWDTMLGAHVAQNRQKTGLKVQAYMKLGVIGYDDAVDPYMKGEEADKYGDNAKNRMQEAMRDMPEEVCLYCAMDSLLTFRLYEIQTAQLDKKEKGGLDLLIDSDIALSQIQQNGMRIDVPKMAKTKRELTERIGEMKRVLSESPKIQAWEKEKGKRFNYNSVKDFTDYLFSFCGYSSEKQTATGNPSTDAEALRALFEKHKDPVIEAVLEIKRWDKALGTYIGQFERELVGEFIHPNFRLNNVQTFRSSASSPNFQNIPKRDKEVKKTIRSFIVPRPGHKLKEYDYGAMEVGAGCFYHKDKNLIWYITKGKDFHLDSTCDLLYKKKEDVDKATERSLVKNAFTFPEFYGSYWKKVAPDLWDRLTKESKEWLRAHGIKTFAKFQEHVKAVEKKLWERFPQFKRWMSSAEKEYQRNGYLRMLTGFRVQWPMGRNEIINYRTQGTAFHCLLYTLSQIQLNEASKLESRIIGQIHDALVWDIAPGEEERVDYLMWWYGTQKIREDWPWINVPLKIEAEASAVDGSWAEMGEEVLLDFSNKKEED